MEHPDGLVLHIQPAADEDEERLASATQRLRTALLDLNVDAVTGLTGPGEPDGAKGLSTLIGWLSVHFSSPEAFRSVLTTVTGWAMRTGYTVEVNYGEDALKISRVTSAQQERIINDFIARHATRP